MLLTKTQKRIPELVREYGGMKAEMLERLCGGSQRFEVMLRQLEANRIPVFVAERIEQTELLTVPPDCRFAVKQNNKYIFYGGS